MDYSVASSALLQSLQPPKEMIVNNDESNQIPARAIARTATRLAKLERRPVALVATTLALRCRNLGIALQSGDSTSDVETTYTVDPRRKAA